MMEFTLKQRRRPQARRALAARNDQHARAVALLDILNRQRGGGIGSLTSFTPSLLSDAPGQFATRSGARQLGNAGFTTPQRNAPVVAETDNSPATDVPFGGGAFAAPALSSALPGAAPVQFGFAGAPTIANQPLNAGIFSAGEQAAEGAIADDGGHNRRQADENRKPSRVEIALLRAKYRSIVIAGRAAGYNFAASNLNHWLSGKGGTKNVSWNWLKKQGSFRVAYEQNIRTVERGIELLEGVAASNGRNGKDAGASGSVSESSIVRPSGRSDFFYGSGDSHLDTTAKIKTTVRSDGKLVTNVEFSHRWYDDYDWNRGSFARIEAAWGLRVDTYDDDARKLRDAGHGRDYLLESKMKEHWR